MFRWEVHPIRGLTVPDGREQGRGEEVAALLTAARAVLENRAFTDAAGAILGACRASLGADGGLVAVSRAGAQDFDVSCLDPGHLEVDCAAGLPAPLARLSARACKGTAVYANDLSKSTASAPLSLAVPRIRRARCSRRSSSTARWQGSSAWLTSPGASRGYFL